jgi:hypothetical protein
MRAEDGRYSGPEPLREYGSPPRVRGRPERQTQRPQDGRFTPACAGTATRPGHVAGVPTDHRRVCEDGGVKLGAVLTQNGSPPRVRGRLSGRAIGAAVIDSETVAERDGGGSAAGLLPQRDGRSLAAEHDGIQQPDSGRQPAPDHGGARPRRSVVDCCAPG